MAQVPRTSPVWTALAVLAAIAGVTVAMLLIFVAEARAACVQFKAALQRARVLQAIWPTPAAALVSSSTRPAPPSSKANCPPTVRLPVPRARKQRSTSTSRDTTGAIAALELAQAYLEEVRDAEVPDYADATLRKLHLNTLALATGQLERGMEMDPDAFLEGNDAQGNPRRLGFTELKAEALLLEGLTHQANDVRRAIVALAASTVLRPDNPHAFFALGLSRAAIGQKSGAVEALRQAVAINPKSIIYRKELNRPRTSRPSRWQATDRRAWGTGSSMRR
jgi:tetratricopeptide (TPR) repeat protein